jgi:hypothetical protein
VLVAGKAVHLLALDQGLAKTISQAEGAALESTPQPTASSSESLLKHRPLMYEDEELG